MVNVFVIYAGYAVAALLVLQFLTGLINLLWRQWPGQRTDVGGLNVSVLIPARNEEKNIGNLLRDLINQTHQQIEVLVYDDMSDDMTAEIVEACSRTDGKIRLISGKELPEGWLGKNHACDLLASEAKGDYYLFLDADVSVERDFVEKISGYALSEGNDLTSVFPRQKMKTPGEWITVPLMNYILLSLLPLVLVRRSSMTAFSAANGQCMLFGAGTYDRLRPHQVMKLNKVEDIAISRYYKRNNKKVASLASVREISCRMYTNYRDALSGFSKNVAAFFGNSLLLAIVFWIVVTFGWLLVWNVFPFSYFLILLILNFIKRLFISKTSHQSPFLNLLFIIPQNLNLGILVFLSLYKQLTRGYTWKGRKI